jgi:hypothetical protein
MDVAQLAALPIGHLALLADDVATLKADAKTIGDKFATALHTRFGDQAAVTRRIEGKDTGRVRFQVNHDAQRCSSGRGTAAEAFLVRHSGMIGRILQTG